MKVQVKIRQDNERGLFAIEDIRKGEVVCILPIDYFQLDSNWYSTYEQDHKINFRYGIVCEIIASGGMTQYESFSSFFKDKKEKCCFNSTKTIEIIGVSNPDNLNDNFVGHMINDYVDMSFLSEKNYEKMSTEFSNVKVSPNLKIFTSSTNKKRLGLKIRSTKDIKKDSELYLSYGSDYWKKYSGKERFVYSIKLSVIC
jgi:hypothetical protein